jgi:hypothetical protein
VVEVMVEVTRDSGAGSGAGFLCHRMPRLFVEIICRKKKKATAFVPAET